MLYASRLYRALPTRRRFAAEDNPDELPDLGRGNTDSCRGMANAA